ncbi:MAG: DUF4835 family protein [Ignavibacteriae bacterium]|nr:DUF4835 family protein [Ignavibacteriota bacterium]
MHARILLSSFSLLVILFVQPLAAQEVNCVVRVNYESVPAASKDLLATFESDVREYVNNYKWGPEVLDEKIECTLEINVQSVVGDNRYSAQAFIGSSRTVFNGGKSAMLRLVDDAWDFMYVKGRPLNHNLYSFSDLTSFLDFYMLLVIGYDYDSYIEMSGTTFFQKAADIASLARTSGAKGWQPAKSGYSRLQLIEEVLNAKFAPVRSASYKYHFAGLDSLTDSKEQALDHIASAIRAIGEVRKAADPRNQVIRVFFGAKYQEVAELLIGYSDPRIFLELATMDPEHQSTYEEYRKKRL